MLVMNHSVNALSLWTWCFVEVMEIFAFEKAYLWQNELLYSYRDLEDIDSGILLADLRKLCKWLLDHISTCQVMISKEKMKMTEWFTGVIFLFVLFRFVLQKEVNAVYVKIHKWYFLFNYALWSSVHIVTIRIIHFVTVIKIVLFVRIDVTRCFVN